MRVTNTATCALLCIGLFACQKPQTIIIPQAVPVKVQRPPLRIKALPKDATTDQILRAYVLDLADQVGYADQLEILIWGPTPAPVK